MPTVIAHHGGHGPDMDAVMAAMHTDPAREATAADGVLPETLVIVVERRP